MMKLQIVSRSGRKITDLDVTDKTTVVQLKNHFAVKCPKYPVHRQRFTFESAPLLEGKSIYDYKLKDGDTLLFKDLGPQVGWGTVFFIEYFGPLLIYPIFYFHVDLIYGSKAPETHDQVQQIALLCWSAHYIKRILETLFVHRFSHASMPLFSLFKNCFHYWGAAFAISYFVNHPLYTPPPQTNVYAGLAIFIISELMNGVSHLQLRALRPSGTTQRSIPRNLLFELVSCPNYFFEILAWTGFSILTQTFTAYLFTLLGAGQMWLWAVEKHRRYKKEFDGKEGRPLYPKNRKVLVPFVL